MNPVWLLPLSACFPLFLALVAPLPRVRAHALLLLPLACVPVLAAAFLVPQGALLELTAPFPRASWIFDATSQVFLQFSALVWTTSSLAVWASPPTHSPPATFAVPFLLALGGNLLLLGSADALTFYAGFAIMGFASWGLVVQERGAEARRAGRVYLALVLLGELFLLPGLVLLSLRADSLSFCALRAAWRVTDDGGVAQILLFAGFGIKAGLVPFHFWLPLAHPIAPTPASAVLSGCMIKVGLLGLLRVLPLGRLALPGLADRMEPWMLAGLVAAPLLGILQRSPKVLLAYSSIAKSSLLLLLLLRIARSPDIHAVLLPGIHAYALFHGLHKSALFLGVPALRGIGRVGWVPLILLASSFAGLPALPGSALKSVTDALPRWVADTSALLGLALMIRFVWLSRPTRGASAGLPALLWTGAVALAFLWPSSLPWSFAFPSPFVWLGIPLALLLPALPLHPAPGDILTLFPSWNLGLRWMRHAELRLSGAPGGLLLIALLLGLLLLPLF